MNKLLKKIISFFTLDPMNDPEYKKLYLEWVYDGLEGVHKKTEGGKA